MFQGVRITSLVIFLFGFCSNEKVSLVGFLSLDPRSMSEVSAGFMRGLCGSFMRGLNRVDAGFMGDLCEVYAVAIFSASSTRVRRPRG